MYVCIIVITDTYISCLCWDGLVGAGVLGMGCNGGSLLGSDGSERWDGVCVCVCVHPSIHLSIYLHLLYLRFCCFVLCSILPMYCV